MKSLKIVAVTACILTASFVAYKKKEKIIKLLKSPKTLKLLKVARDIF